MPAARMGRTAWTALTEYFLIWAALMKHSFIVTKLVRHNSLLCRTLKDGGTLYLQRHRVNRVFKKKSALFCEKSVNGPQKPISCPLPFFCHRDSGKSPLLCADLHIQAKKTAFCQNNVKCNSLYQDILQKTLTGSSCSPSLQAFFSGSLFLFAQTVPKLSPNEACSLHPPLEKPAGRPQNTLRQPWNKQVPLCRIRAQAAFGHRPGRPICPPPVPGTGPLSGGLCASRHKVTCRLFCGQILHVPGFPVRNRRKTADHGNT